MFFSYSLPRIHASPCRKLLHEELIVNIVSLDFLSRTRQEFDQVGNTITSLRLAIGSELADIIQPPN